MFRRVPTCIPLVAAFLCVLVLSAQGLPTVDTETVTEYLCLAAQRPPSLLKWVTVTYPKGVGSAKDVTITPLNASTPETGAWFNLDIKTGFALTGKIIGDSMYAYYSKSGQQQGGCCADTLRIYSKADGSIRDLDLAKIIPAAMPGVTAQASHTFDVKEIDGVVYGFAMVRYVDSNLGTVAADAIVSFNTVTGEIRETADGKTNFNIHTAAGEEKSGQDKAAAVFKIQFFKPSTTGEFEEWHGNGVEHFKVKDGTYIVGITHRNMAEAVLFKDPYTYKTSEGGGTILQRFGTPTQYTAKSQSYHYFGMKPDNKMGYFSGGVHNIYYRPESESFNGRESVSLFVNTASKTGKGYAVEFALNLVHSQPSVVNDTVFATDYVAAELSFSARAQGGARAIGNGVLLAMSGIEAVGLEVADTSGNTHSYAYPVASGGTPPPLYDPFIFVTKK